MVLLISLEMSLIPFTKMVAPEFFRTPCLGSKNNQLTFVKKIIFANEMHFEMCGYINNQHYLRPQNLQIIHGKPLHPRLISVWVCILIR